MSCTKYGAIAVERETPIRDRIQKQARQHPKRGIHQPQNGHIAQMAAHAVADRQRRRGAELPPAVRTEAHRDLAGWRRNDRKTCLTSGL